MILQEVISSPLISKEVTGSPALRLGDFIFMTALDASMLEGFEPSMRTEEQTERCLPAIKNLNSGRISTL